MTPVKRKQFDKSFHHHERHLLQQVGTKATGPRSTFAKKLPPMKSAAEDEVCGAANMTADKGVEFQVRLSNAETEAATGGIADTDRVANQLQREIYMVSRGMSRCGSGMNCPSA